MATYIEWLLDDVEGESYNQLMVQSVEATLKNEQVLMEVELSITLMDNATIREINLEQRDIDKATDVLSFPMVELTHDQSIEQQLKSTMKNPETGLVYLGDVVISWDKVLEQKEAYGHSTERELSFLVVHSMLHLLGYDHMEEDEEKVMEFKQKEIMNELGIVR